MHEGCRGTARPWVPLGFALRGGKVLGSPRVPVRAGGVGVELTAFTRSNALETPSPAAELGAGSPGRSRPAPWRPITVGEGRGQRHACKTGKWSQSYGVSGDTVWTGPTGPHSTVPHVSPERMTQCVAELLLPDAAARAPAVTSVIVNRGDRPGGRCARRRVLLLQEAFPRGAELGAAFCTAVWKEMCPVSKELDRRGRTARPDLKAVALCPAWLSPENREPSFRLRVRINPEPHVRLLWA